MKDTIERRLSSRVLARFKISVSSATGLLLEGLTENISMKGLYFRTQYPLPMGASCRVTIVFQGDKGEEELVTRAHVAHIEPEGIGLEFVSLDPKMAEILTHTLEKESAA